jgi:hypothetical protein
MLMMAWRGGPSHLGIDFHRCRDRSLDRRGPQLVDRLGVAPQTADISGLGSALYAREITEVC